MNDNQVRINWNFSGGAMIFVGDERGIALTASEVEELREQLNNHVNNR